MKTAVADISFATLAPATERSRGWTQKLRPGLRHLARHVFLGVAFALALGCAFALVIRLSCKDSLPALAPLYYGTPLALIWSGLAFSSGMFFALRKPRWTIAAGILACACWGAWQETSMVASEPVPSKDAIPVVFWNTARLRFGWDGVAQGIQSRSAPLMGFVEAGPDDAQARKRWEEAFPEYQRVFFGNGMVLLFQGKILETERGRLGRGSYFGRAVLEWKEKRVTVFLVDIHSNPFFSRQSTLGRLTDLVSASPGPVIIMGDFNTPSDSVHFGPLRENFQNAFEARGQGNLATWPVPCPVLAIDHIWANRRVAVHSARHESSLQSDHQAVVAELSFSE